MSELNLITWVKRRSFRRAGERKPTFLGTVLTVDTILKNSPISGKLLNRIQDNISDIIRARYYNFDPLRRIFSKVQIQTQTGCNLSCPFCPANKKEIELPKGQMSDSLFKKIIRELADLEFSGVIAPYLQNEPLLDPRLEDLQRLLEEEPPDS